MHYNDETIGPTQRRAFRTGDRARRNTSASQARVVDAAPLPPLGSPASVLQESNPKGKPLARFGRGKRRLSSRRSLARERSRLCRQPHDSTSGSGFPSSDDDRGKNRMGRLHRTERAPGVAAATAHRSGKIAARRSAVGPNPWVGGATGEASKAVTAKSSRCTSPKPDKTKCICIVPDRAATR